jgi:DeoR/GlpR family transcriptional regulator of sugar metabolism
MLATERRAKLLDIVRRQGFASLTDMAEQLGVSESTIRRDLVRLEREGVARRTHGGAFYTGPSPSLAHFMHRQEAAWDKKKAIAAAAARLVADVDTLLLDGGSTTYELARLLVGRPLQVITNSLPVANLFSSAANVDLVVVGGYVHSRSGAIFGEYADRMLRSLRVAKAVISAAAINERGLYNDNHMLADTQRAMVEAADEVFVVADSTKFGRQSLAAICELSDVDHFVVDEQLEPRWRELLAKAEVHLQVADSVLPADARVGSALTSGDLVTPGPGDIRANSSRESYNS